MHFPRFLLLISGIAGFFASSSTTLQAQTPFALSDPTIAYRLDSHTDVFIDSTSSLPVDSIIQPSFQKQFIRRGNLTFGYEQASIWLKICIRTDDPANQWYLNIPAPYLEYVDFYENADSGLMHFQSGYYRPQSVRQINHTSHVIPLRFGSDGISTVYINITGLSPKTFPLYAIEKEVFAEKTQLEDIGYGIFFGILLVMFLYNLFIYLSLRQVNYLLYILTIIGTFFIFSAASGYAGKYLWPEHPHFNFYAGRLSLGVQAIFVGIFTLSFLNVKRYSKTMYYALLALIPLGMIANVLVYTKIMVSAGNNLITLGVILYMVTGIVCLIKGNKIATYFIAAWAIYLTGGLLLTLRNSGVFDFNFWTTHFVEIGAAMETTIIAFALGDLYRRYKQEKEAAQAHALKLQLTATETLEQKVRERTEQLSKTNEELQQTLETVQRQKEIIQHKNSELDAFFYRISHDLRGPVSSLLGLSTLAKREVNDPKALEYIDRQHQQTARLDHIIDGLINLTTLNHTDLPRQQIDFNKMIDECIGSLNEMPNFRNILFKKDINPELEFTCEWILLQAIFQNLIENSIKYSREQDPYVTVSVRGEGRWLVLEVEDNGHGIPKEHQHKVFNMFYRATHRANGTGLGLYILKRSVDRLQGTIEVKSEEGYGSTFTVKLPV
jgi:signal transduction histidine kinase